jgi:predicted ATPase
MLAEADRALGQLSDALGAVETGLALGEETKQHAHDSDLQRLRGEILLEQKDGREPETEECFQRALEEARRNQAKSAELRAAVSLSRLLQQQGRGQEGRVLLADVFEWFGEGFDTADLREAKALLQELP